MAINNDSIESIRDPRFEGLEGLDGIRLDDMMDDSNGYYTKGRSSSSSKSSKQPSEYDIFGQEMKQLARSIKGNLDLIEPEDFSTGVGSETSKAFGQSKYDSPVMPYSEVGNINNIRGEKQSGIAQITNGILKAGVLTGTTFLNGTVGVLSGLGALIDGDESTTYWNNGFTQAMKSINDWSEKNIANYYTDDERENPLAARNIFSGNFLGDKFLKNLGFTAGALLAAQTLGAGVLGAISSFGSSATAFMAGTAPRFMMSLAGAFVSAANEGSIEALNNAMDWKKTAVNELNSRYQAKLDAIDSYLADNGGQSLVPTYDAEGNIIGYSDPIASNAEYERQQALNEYQNDMDRINQDYLKLGNRINAHNIPILMASNLIEFGRLFTGGYRTGRNVANATVGKYLLEGVAKPASEAFEEGFQSDISLAMQKKYQYDLDNFYANGHDPETEEKTLNTIDAYAKAIMENLKDPNVWEERLIGALTGALGSPTFGRSANSSEDTVIGKNGLFGWSGGIPATVINARENINRRKTADEKLDEYLNGDSIAKGVAFMTRHGVANQIKDMALERGDKKTYEDADAMELFNMIQYASDTGRLGELINRVNKEMDTSDDSLIEITANTSSKDANGKTVGPFVDKDGNPIYLNDVDTSDMSDDEKKMTKQGMIDTIKHSRQEIVDAVKNFQKIRRAIDSQIGDKLSDAQLHELTFLSFSLDNRNSRGENMTKSLQKDASSKIEELSNQLEILNTQAENPRISAEKDKISNKIKSLVLFSKIKPSDAWTLITSQNPLSRVITDSIKTNDNEQLIKDVIAVREDSVRLNNKIAEYTANPEKIIESIDEITNKQNEQKRQLAINNFEKSIAQFNNENDINNAIYTENSLTDDDINEALDKAIKSGNKAAKNVRSNRRLQKTLESAISLIKTQDESVKSIAGDIVANFPKDIYTYDDAIDKYIKTFREGDGVTESVKKAVDELITAFSTANEAYVKNNNQRTEAVKNKPASSDGQQKQNTGNKKGDDDIMSSISTGIGVSINIPNGTKIPQSNNGGVPIEGQTKEEVLNNVADAIHDKNNAKAKEIAEKGVSTSLSADEHKDVTIKAQEAAKNIVSANSATTIDVTEVSSASDYTTQDADEEKVLSSNKKDENKNEDVKSEVITEYKIHDAKANHSKVAYTPTSDKFDTMLSILNRFNVREIIKSSAFGQYFIRNPKVNIYFAKLKEDENTLYEVVKLDADLNKRLSQKGLIKETLKANNEEYVIVGVVANNSSQTYDDIINASQNEFSTMQDSDVLVTDKVYSRITKFGSGRFVTSSDNEPIEWKSVGNILNGLTYGTDYGFSIVTDKQYIYGINSDYAVTLNDNAQKMSGSVWLYLPAANGVFYPIGLQVARPNSNTLKSDLVVKKIGNKTVTFFDAMKVLLDTNSTYNEKFDAKCAIEDTIFMPKGSLVFYKEGIRLFGVNYEVSGNSIDDVINNAINSFDGNKTTRFNISSSINDSVVRESIISSGALLTNLIQPEFINATFSIDSPYTQRDDNDRPNIRKITAPAESQQKELNSADREKSLYIGDDTYKVIQEKNGDVFYKDNRDGSRTLVDDENIKTNLIALNEFTSIRDSGGTPSDSFTHKNKMYAKMNINGKHVYILESENGRYDIINASSWSGAKAVKTKAQTPVVSKKQIPNVEGVVISGLDINPNDSLLGFAIQAAKEKANENEIPQSAISFESLFDDDVLNEVKRIDSEKDILGEPMPDDKNIIINFVKQRIEDAGINPKSITDKQQLLDLFEQTYC